MRASKETAKKARRFANELGQDITEGGVRLSSRMQSQRREFLLKFIETAERKLPSEAAYERERKRKRT